MLLGIDTGGTFTDFVLYDGQQLRVHKVLSTPQAPEQAILQGIRELGIVTDRDLQIVHGSTVATNAVLEGKGMRTAYITNRGLGDVLLIGRQARRELYNLQPAPLQLPVERSLCLETGGRLAADGSVVEPLTDADLLQLRESLQRLQPAAVAINLLFSFLDDRFERAIEAMIPEGIFVSRSSEILPVYREYERGMTTWLNAYVGPLVQGYLARLQAGIGDAGLAIMHSAGGTLRADEAGRRAVQLLLSGPAGGLAGARYVADAAGERRLLTFDMGGTSTDVALIDGEIPLSGEARINDLPVSVPTVDMHTIGAGGGSIASVDAGGLLQVGPASAGADPGPACYGRGGRQATVTDANLLLGRLPATALLGGSMQLDPAAAQAALAPLAEAMRCTLQQAALGVIEIANEHMARALRVISIQRGHDPRDFTLMSFGGAGGLHVCALAEALGMQRAIVPAHGGVLSALGMLVAPRSRELGRTLSAALAGIDTGVVENAFAAMQDQGRAALRSEGVADAAIRVRRAVDVCYRGQAYTFNVPWSTPAAVEAAFHDLHAQRYGHAMQLPVELVNLRVSLHGPATTLQLPAPGPRGAAAVARDWLQVHAEPDRVPVYARAELASGQLLEGPAVIGEAVATTWLARGWRAQVHASGSLLLQRGSD